MTTSSANQEPALAGVNHEARERSGDSLGSPAPAMRLETSELGQLRERLTAERERYLNLAADFEAFKKRAARENEGRAREHRDTFIRELLPVIDDLERALAGAPATQTSAVKDGVTLIVRQLFRLLRQHGFDSELSLGQRFDPHRHEAMRTRINPEFADQTILEVWQRGWRRGNELFRPAKVVVNDLNPPAETGHGI